MLWIEAAASTPIEALLLDALFFPSILFTEPFLEWHAGYEF
jgi:hypothetical protein